MRPGRTRNFEPPNRMTQCMASSANQELLSRSEFNCCTVTIAASCSRDSRVLLTRIHAWRWRCFLADATIRILNPTITKLQARWTETPQQQGRQLLSCFSRFSFSWMQRKKPETAIVTGSQNLPTGPPHQQETAVTASTASVAVHDISVSFWRPGSSRGDCRWDAGSCPSGTGCSSRSRRHWKPP